MNYRPSAALPISTPLHATRRDHLLRGRCHECAHASQPYRDAAVRHSKHCLEGPTLVQRTPEEDGRDPAGSKGPNLYTQPINSGVKR
jgi:hypothetical protein